MTNAESLILDTPAQITLAWLAKVLPDQIASPLSALAVARIGNGLMSATFRVCYVADGGDRYSVIVKLASQNASTRRNAAEMGLYQREVGFYRDFAPHCGMRVPGCYYAAIDERGERFTLVLEDFPRARVCDQIAGSTEVEAVRCVEELAKLHAVWWNNPVLETYQWVLHRDREWAVRHQNAIERGTAHIEQIASNVLDTVKLGILRRFRDRFADFHSLNEAPSALIHHDYRSDNLLFPDDGSVVVIDFQTLSRGAGCTDVAFFVQGSLPIEVRRQCERSLVLRYWEALCKYGVASYGLEQCWRDYRRQTWTGMVIVLLGAVVADRTSRGDRLFNVWTERILNAAVDLEAAEFLD